jgi:lipoprotein-anchoring transpeptidase ErfK/SrfK
VQAFNDDGGHRLATGEHPKTTKRIVVDRAKQMLYAYEGDTLFMEQSISTGLDDTPTPRGTFTVYAMTPSRYMQGPIDGVSTQSYDLPGVPWNLYFTNEGAVIHGAYWHNHFGKQWSHGCVNLPPEKAKELYDWAELGMKVTVR